MGYKFQGGSDYRESGIDPGKEAQREIFDCQTGDIGAMSRLGENKTGKRLKKYASHKKTKMKMVTSRFPELMEPSGRCLSWLEEL